LAGGRSQRRSTGAKHGGIDQRRSAARAILVQPARQFGLTLRRSQVRPCAIQGAFGFQRAAEHRARNGGVINGRLLRVHRRGQSQNQHQGEQRAHRDGLSITSWEL